MTLRPKQRRIGVPWFQPIDYTDIVKLCPELPLSFAAWRKGARQVVEAATAQGVQAVQVHISAADLAAFAKQRRSPIIGSEILIDWCQERPGADTQRQGSAAAFEQRFRREVAHNVVERRQKAKAN